MLDGIDGEFMHRQGKYLACSRLEFQAGPTQQQAFTFQSIVEEKLLCQQRVQINLPMRIDGTLGSGE